MIGRVMRIALGMFVLVGFLAAIPVAPARTQTTEEVDALSAQAIDFYNQGQYIEGINVAERALGLAERLHGPEHIEVGRLLNLLASLFDALGRYADAEPLYRRTLAIAEKVLGPTPVVWAP
jgi:tetratricopeptide (TPR) repeat protein